jgi:hypothetical protein
MWWQHGPYMWGPGWWIFLIFGMIVCMIFAFLMFRFMLGRGCFGGHQDQSEAPRTQGGASRQGWFDRLTMTKQESSPGSVEGVPVLS